MLAQKPRLDARFTKQQIDSDKIYHVSPFHLWKQPSLAIQRIPTRSTEREMKHPYLDVHRCCGSVAFARRRRGATEAGGARQKAPPPPPLPAPIRPLNLAARRLRQRARWRGGGGGGGGGGGLAAPRSHHAPAPANTPRAYRSTDRPRPLAIAPPARLTPPRRRLGAGGRMRDASPPRWARMGDLGRCSFLRLSSDASVARLHVR